MKISIVVRPNLFMVLFRTLLLSLFLLSSATTLGDVLANSKPIGDIVAILVIAILVGLFIGYSLVAWPTRIVIDGDSIVLHYLLSPRVEFSERHLRGFSSALTVSKGSILGTDGLVFYLSDGRRFTVSEWNLRSLAEVKNYLQTSGVQYFGSERTALPLFRFRYRFDK